VSYICSSNFSTCLPVQHKSKSTFYNIFLKVLLLSRLISSRRKSYRFFQKIKLAQRRILDIVKTFTFFACSSFWRVSPRNRYIYSTTDLLVRRFAILCTCENVHGKVRDGWTSVVTSESKKAKRIKYEHDLRGNVILGFASVHFFTCPRFALLRWRLSISFFLIEERIHRCNFD